MTVVEVVRCEVVRHHSTTSVRRILLEQRRRRCSDKGRLTTRLLHVRPRVHVRLAVHAWPVRATWVEFLPRRIARMDGAEVVVHVNDDSGSLLTENRHCLCEIAMGRTLKHNNVDST